MIAPIRNIFIATLLLLIGASGLTVTADDALTQDMKEDVAALVAAAKLHNKAWPWQGPLQEIDRVARHGKQIAPALVSLLRYDSMEQWSDGSWDIHVEQQLELALCKIYGVAPESGKTVYGIRSFEEDNKKIRQFWQSKVGNKRN